ncbi:MAG: poly(3-hydroxybutyrate) depolymerase [Bdellovibrionales bacterium]|nr:poly(3-hydroxybutyrate) depolymerase [Bdellovibrionales bacterium]
MEAIPAPVVTGVVGKKIEKSGDYTFAIQHGGLTRYYIVHVPKSYRAELPVSLLLVLHGGGGDMQIQATDEFYKQISKSESQGFVAVFANGYSRFKSGKFATWNAGTCCAAARDQNVDDVGFIKQVVTNVREQLNIDEKKIYAAGISNGAMMSYRLACEMSDVFSGIAAVAGTDNTVKCPQGAAVSILHIHAQNDDHVLFAGGAGEKAFKDRSLISEFVSVPKTVEKWVSRNGCKAPPKRILEKDGAYCDRYSGCKANSSVQLCVTATGGHSWPGGKKPRSGSDTKPSTAISANDVMWEFFNRK